jgi:hypothetical protein
LTSDDAVELRFVRPTDRCAPTIADTTADFTDDADNEANDYKTAWTVRFYTHNINIHLLNTTRTYTNVNRTFLLVMLVFRDLYTAPQHPTGQAQMTYIVVMV